ncbi:MULTISPECIES: peptidoglycan D,D-transpeptidase FtsI family protein [Curtobacterium]|uniref:peptidoglycan D,D-transpeptidase FtsI family protein n=1 Tax=Curtobacterium TaxID=2034 RepID=UPI000DA89CCD|nr:MULTISPECIES: penicillin-binding protein 2 [Curtobacterium]MBY0176229.1 penicillin-binding protein 2 [Curtobacterium herbarum]MCP1501646.1 cell division protein FtsI (penicillin-binding protein 3) [Curtobacterium herbarum]MDN4646737.1 penicillin-binding protein 2 [Curtobacterium sp. PsM8]WIE62863.1 penicillin-binding protein 2 [Curtobacterium sp. MCLR17_032]
MTKTLRNRRLRYSVVMIAVIALVAVFVVRLVDIQVVQADELSQAAESKRSIPVTLYGTRGTIVDRDGTALAESVVRYNITTSPRLVKSFEGKLGGTRVKDVSVDQALSAIAKASGGDVATMQKNIAADPKSDFAYLVKGIDVAHYEAVRALQVPWLYPEQQAARSYPTGAATGNVTGFMGTDGAQAGLELAYQKCLAGTNGSETYERGEDGVQLPGSTVTQKRAKDGGTLVTTIDSDLQYMASQDIADAAQQLKAESATATVVNAKTGEVLAVADYPTVDPNDVDATKDPGAYGSRALTAAYEPGSTIKAAIAAALIDKGLASPTTQAVVPYSRTFPWGGTIHDSELHPTENLTLTGILRDSSNVGITELGSKLTTQQRYDVMREFGLFEPEPAIDYPGQPTMNYGASPQWDKQTDINSMFGQGISTTAMQVSSIYQTLANQGVRIPLHMVKGCQTEDGKTIDAPDVQSKRVVSAAAATQTVDMLQSVVTGGTLVGMKPISGYNIAAKTGTAEVADGAKGYGADRIISVAGMAPAEDPQYVVTVTFTKPQTTKWSSGAAPAFRTLMSQVLEKYRVAPSTTQARTYPSTW